MKTSSKLTRMAAAVTGGLLLTSLAACGSDDGSEMTPSDSDASSQAEATGDDMSESTASGPITVENLPERCDELASIATTLRAEAPAEVEPSSVMNANNDGFATRTSHCTYAYEGDDFSDKNRVDIYLDTASGDEAGMKAYWDEIASTEPLTAIDGAEEATWYAMGGTGARSSARALIGDTLVSVRVSVPKDMEDEVFMSKAALATALQSVVDLL